MHGKIICKTGQTDSVIIQGKAAAYFAFLLPFKVYWMVLSGTLIMLLIYSSTISKNNVPALTKLTKKLLFAI